MKAMYKLGFTAVLAFSLIGSAAWAQAPAAQEYEAHHPSASAGSTPTQPLRENAKRLIDIGASMVQPSAAQEQVRIMPDRLELQERWLGKEDR
jgi:hypothetical protein